MRGRSWFDHEFGSGMLAPEEAGWDWFSLHLSDGRDLMIYLLRRQDGSVEAASSGTLIESDGRARPLARDGIRIDVLDHWKSARSGGRYPGRWRIRLPAKSWTLKSGRSCRTRRSAPRPAGPGLLGRRRPRAGPGPGRSVAAEGYVELTGYAGAPRRLLARVNSSD